jgi:hypothetical protein
MLRGALMSSNETCPINGCDLRGEEIKPESLAKGYYGPWDGVEKRYYSKMVGVQIRGVYDGVCYWFCPECGERWHRFAEGDSYRRRVEACWAREEEEVERERLNAS